MLGIKLAVSFYFVHFSFYFFFGSDVLAAAPLPLPKCRAQALTREPARPAVPRHRPPR